MSEAVCVTIPDFSLVVLVGPTGSGKSSFAAQHFLPTEIISSDHCRALVSDDETDQAATGDAFDLLRYMAGIRLKRRLLTVIDATSVKREDRAELIRLAREYHALPVALVLDIDPAICADRNADRTSRDFGPHVPRNHSRMLRRGLRGLQKEGFRNVHIMRSPAQADAVVIEREPLWTDKRSDYGPFDIIGDIHGCLTELVELLSKLGYEIDPFQPGEETLIGGRHPEGRRAFFVGDITDRGPRNIDCLRLVMGMCEESSAHCILGNHDQKLARWLNGRKVQINHGLEQTVAEFENASDEFRGRVVKFIGGLLSHHWLAGGDLVVAHAGLRETMHGRGSPAVRSFAMFGETSGEIDEFGLPVRTRWALDYRGRANVIYGHTPVTDAEWLNDTMCIDTGCVFGGKLTALRWPERETVYVDAKQQYSVPAKPLENIDGRSAQQDHDRLLYFDDFAGKNRIETRYGSTILIPRENSLAALETVSRFAVDPRWLIYVPPTMAPCPTASLDPFLEHPEQALQYFAERGVTDLVAEEKHMGSRALAVIARNADTARARFGVEDDKAGIIYTRTGRPFFSDDGLEAGIVARVAAGLDAAGLWTELASDWVLLDCELMPWSAKAHDLLERQYRPTVAAARTSAEALLQAIAASDGIEGLEQLKANAERERLAAEAMGRTIDGYCWPARSIDDYRLAPFHLLAAEGSVFDDRPHVWHMETLSRLAATDHIIQVTGWKQFDPTNEQETAALADWWIGHTEAGGEGLVIKPNAFLVADAEKFVQPAMKVRGRDYLRIIYGPDYDRQENLVRLRKRGLGRKFALAEREFKLGLEGLHRFVDEMPLARIHECALGVLAMESEPVDPRL